MKASEEQELRNRVGDLVLDWHTAGNEEGLDSATEDDFGTLIQAAHVVADESDHSLKRWVDAGRRAGLSWTDIGVSLGTSRQAAQQRFANPGMPTKVTADDPSTIVRTGVTAFNEVAVLEEEGKLGREVVGATWLTLFFRQTDAPVENIRVVSFLGPSVTQKYEDQGWTHALTWYPYRYFTRPTNDDS